MTISDEESRPAAGKVLAKWRPKQTEPAEASTNGTAPAAAPAEVQANAAAE